MISTIERDFKVENGIASFPMKEYPDWYGIPGIGFIWHNTQADPEIEYKGKRINSTIIEDTMWYDWTHDDYGNHLSEKENDDNGFSKYMRENAEEVYELIELAMNGSD